MKLHHTFVFLAVTLMFIPPSFLGESFAANAVPHTTLASGIDFPGDLVVSSGYAYYLYQDAEQLTGFYGIDQVPIGGGASSLVISLAYFGPSDSVSFIVKGSYVYFNNGSGSGTISGSNAGIYRVPVTGGAARLLYSCACYGNIRVIGGNLYFINVGSSGGDIYEMPIVGSSTPVDLASVSASWITIVSPYLYFLSLFGRNWESSSCRWNGYRIFNWMFLLSFCLW